VFSKATSRSALIVFSCLAVGLMTNTASAVTAEVAKKCSALMQQAYPPREPGNPAAGSVKGTGQIEQDYFKKCLANGGNVGDDTSKEKK
jgi:hypothetical protein